MSKVPLYLSLWFLKLIFNFWEFHTCICCILIMCIPSYSSQTLPHSQQTHTRSQFCDFCCFFSAGHGFQLMRPIYPRVWGHLLEYGPPTRGHALTTLPQRRKLPIPPQLGVGLMVPPPLVLECWLAWSCVGSHSCCVFMSTLVMSRGHCFGFIHPTFQYFYYYY